MKKYALLVSCVILPALLLGMQDALAGERNGAYIAFSALGTLSDIEDLTLVGESTAVELVDPAPEIVAGLAPAIGFDFPGQPLRVELQYLWRYRFDIDAETVEPSPRGIKANVATHSVYFNGYYDIPIDSAWSAYLGAGIGLAHHSLDTESFSGARHTRSGHGREEFSWHAGLGMRRELGRRWIVDFSWRYSDLGSLDAGRGTLAEVEADRYFSHDFLLGVAYAF